MKLGIVIESLDPRRGGAEQWTYQFARQAIAGGHELHVLASQFAPAALELGIYPEHVPVGLSKTGFAVAAETVAARLPLDVVLDTGCGSGGDVFQPHGGSRTASFEQNLLLAPAWLRSGKRLAARWLPRYAEFRQLTARQYGDPRRTYVAISRMVADDLVRYHGVSRSQIRLVYNGVDTARFTPARRALERAPLRARLGVADQETLLLIVAHNFRLKGVPTLLRATQRWRRAGAAARVVVVGGKRTASYEALAQRLGVAEAVTFVGSVDDPTAYYAAADVYVQPTFYDPCSLVVLEALASGLPVVTSRFNGAGELITPGREGYLIDNPADADELAQAVEPLFSPAHRAQLSRAARELAEQHPFERNTREMLAVCEAVAGRRRAAA